MDKKFLCILLVASDGYRISLNNSRPLINRLPQNNQCPQTEMNNCLPQTISPLPSRNLLVLLSPPPSVKMKSDQLFFSDDLTL